MTKENDDIKTVRAGAAVIAYRVLGSSDAKAPTVCMIASTGRGPEDFVHLAEILAEGGLRVALPWPRGMGTSKGSLDDIDFHDLAADAGAVLEAEKRSGPAVIVGHAYGCWIARTLANDRPDLVDGLILLAAGAGKWSDDLSRAIEIAMNPEEPEEARLAALRRGFFCEGSDARPWLEGWNGRLVEAQRAARARTEQPSWWPSGRAPILDVIGLQDPFRPADSLQFYVNEFKPRVELQAIDGASHALPDEKPAEVAAEMLRWIDELSTRAADGA